MFNNLGKYIVALALLFLSSMPAHAVLPNIFATQPSGNVAASLLDTNFTFLEKQGVQGFVTSGSSNSYVATPPDAWTVGYTSYVGRALTVVPNFTNSAAATINVSGLGIASIYKNVGGTPTALSSGDMVSGVPAILICDGVGFLLANPTQSVTTGVSSITNSDGTLTISPNTGSVVASATTATTSQLGVVKTDGSTITNVSGAISCTTGNSSQLGCLKPDGTTITSSAGTLSAVSSGLPTAVTGTLTGSSTVFTVDFTTYSEDDIFINGVVNNAGAANITVDVSTDGGSTYKSVTRNAFAISSSNTTSQNTTGETQCGTSTGVAGYINGKIAQPSTSSTSTFKYNSFYGSGTVQQVGTSIYASAAAINRIKISTDAGTFTAGTVIIQPISHR